MLRPSRAPATWTLLATMAAVFAIEYRAGAISDVKALIRLGAGLPWHYLDGHYWRLVTALFLHADHIHWLANSIGLLQIGAWFENLFGARRLLFVFFTAGLCASIASSLLSSAISVGASGAILGILGALFFSMRRMKWKDPRRRRLVMAELIFWMLVNIAITFQIPYIDKAAHFSGLISGLVLGMIVPLPRAPRPRPSDEVVDVAPNETP